MLEKSSRVTPVCSANQSDFSSIGGEVDNTPNPDLRFVLQNPVERVSTRTIFFLRDYCKTTSIYLASQRSSQTSAMSSIPPLPSNFDPFNPSRDIGLFNPSLLCSDAETRQFNDVTSFLRNLEHCQRLYRYRRTKLLEYMLWALNGPAWEWFKKQSHFNSLLRFGMALTEAFPLQEQRELELIAQKRTKRKARKAAERAELNDIETAKQTPTLQDLGIFDPSLASDRPEFGLYSNAATFLQHLQQCQHLYRKSDLLNLLPNCLCVLASEWLKTQSEFTSLKRFGRALAKAFPEASVRRAQPSSNLQLSTLDVVPQSIETTSARVTCKLCKQSFNSNKELYEHIRNHEALKPAKDSHLSINAVNLVCETEERPPISQQSHDSPTRPQKPIFESAVASGAVTLLKRSALQPLALETTPEPTERLSACRHCKQTFNSKEMLRQHKREQHAKRPAVSSRLLIDAAKSACESVEISTVNSSPSDLPLPANLGSFNPARPHQDPEKRRFNQATNFIQHLQQCQHLYCESEILEWMEVILCGPAEIWFANQSDFTSLHDFGIALTKAFPERSNLPLPTLETESEPAKRPATCRHCKQTFKFKELLRKHKREQHAKKPVISSPLRSHAPKPVCKAEEKSAVKDVTALPASQELQNRAQEPQQIDVQKPPVISSSLSTTTANSTCKAAEKPATTPTAEASEVTPEQRAEWRSRTAYLSTRLKASRLGLPLNTFVTIPETVESASIQGAACARAMCTTCKQDFSSNNELFEHIREHEALKRINDSHLSINIAKSTCEAVEKPANACPPPPQESPTPPATPRNLVTDTRIPLQPVSPKGSNLPIATPRLTSERVENASIQRIACVRTTCKRCNQIFNSNNKLHEHIRQHHARKPVTPKGSDLRVSAPESLCNTIEKPAVSCSFTPQSAPPTPPATPRSQMSSAEMPSRPVSPKGSHLPIATLRITPKSVEKLPAITPPSSPPRTPVREHHEFHMQKSYLTVDDLSRMFTGKPRPFGLPPHQDRLYSPQRSGIRQSSQPCFSTASKKPYLTIENLSEMFDGKSRRKSLFQGQKNVSSRGFSSGQLRITAYFKLTANQKPSISQDSKSSKPKSLNKHMSAEFIRTAPSENPSEKSADLPYKLSGFSYSKGLPEKSANLPYKLPDVSCTNLKSSAEAPSFILVLLRLLPAFLLALAFVSAISAARMGCINAYEQAISAIGRAIQ